MKKTIFLTAVLGLLLVGCSTPSREVLITQEGVMDHFPYRKGQIRVEKIVTSHSIDEIPGLTITETRFVNHGAPVHVRAYELQRHTITPQDSVIWSFQPSSTGARLDWALPVKRGFDKDNYLGMNNTDYGGGIPLIDVWEKDGGTAIGLFEPVLRDIKMPVQWKYNEDNLNMALQYEYPETVELNEGDTLTTYRSFEYIHDGDFFNTLRAFSTYMQQQEGVVMQPSEPEAFEPVWCAWGYERQFTIDEVIGTLDKVQELGFRWVDVDDGYQIAEGDWETNSRFPGGDKDMRRLTDEIHRRGMLAKLWWAPLAADPGTKCLAEHPERMLRTAEYIPQYISWWDSYYLSPVNPSTKEYTKDLVDRFLGTWNFDGLKIDGQHLNCCPPDYNEHSGLDNPQQAQENLPSFFEDIYNEARLLKPNAVVQVCPCGCAVNYYLVPFFNQAVASDPTSSKQVRMKRKAYAAMAPQLAYYGDHVELTDGGCDFASQIGVGAVIGTKFTYPKDNPNASESFLLTEEKEQLIRHWMRIFKEKNLTRGEYLNLYTWGYDMPETHVIRQNDKMYYAFYADDSFEGEVELRGLEDGKEYTVTDYAAENPTGRTIKGGEKLQIRFEHSYLIEVAPAE
ncbi:MAG: alpha-galactosidase [Paludibacteraceae bacterium]|nr:alpha-galactosidase [Paludibacteraceae bacterium]